LENKKYFLYIKKGYLEKSMAKILVVDDDPGIRTLLRKALTKEGYTVIEAGNGLECLMLQRKHRANLIFVDILMPVKDGFETIREVKEEFPDVPIFVMTGATFEGSTEKLLEMTRKIGAKMTFSKPLNLEEVIEAVKEWIDKPLSPKVGNEQYPHKKKKKPTWFWYILIALALMIGFILGIIISKCAN